MLEILGAQAEQAVGCEHARELMEHMVAHLLCEQRQTITALLCAMEQHHQDWSGAYRLYREHIDHTAVFVPIIEGILELLQAIAPMVVMVDDSYLRKTGKHIDGAGWHRDPLSPGFHVNLAFTQRVIQLSAAVPDPHNPKRARVIPIALAMIPKLPKPDKNASAEQLEEHRKLKEQNAPGAHASRLLHQLREHLNRRCEHQARKIWVCGDGDYTNGTLLSALPAETIYIGRTRRDLSVFALPEAPKPHTRGRKPAYGPALPTPDQIRRDKTIAYSPLHIANGHSETRVRFKHIKLAKWPKAGQKTVVQILIIAPLRYKPRKDGPWRYTEPAYLMCTDPNIPIQQLIQAYFWRWGIEVNFRDEKQLFGTGHAQVRHPHSVRTAPAVCVATYAALLLAGIRTYGFDSKPPAQTPPKWYKRKKHMPMTTSDLIQDVRNRLGFRGLSNFSHFASILDNQATPQKYIHALEA